MLIGEIRYFMKIYFTDKCIRSRQRETMFLAPTYLTSIFEMDGMIKKELKTVRSGGAG